MSRKSKRRIIFSNSVLLAAVLALVPGCFGHSSFGEDTPKWSTLKIEELAPGATAIGKENLGCLAGGEKIVSKRGLILAHPRGYTDFGHPEMIHYLEELAGKVHKNQKSYMVLGDIGGPHGGQIPSIHLSHQRGLDTDIWFQTLKSQSEIDQYHHRQPPLIVDKKGKVKWTKHTGELLKWAAQDPRVDRIFVGASIKKMLCQTLPAEELKGDWFYKIRPWQGHSGHFHVRLKCPEREKAAGLCTMTKDPISPDDPDCGAALDWWFSNEGKNKKFEPSTEPIPQVCQDIAKRAPKNQPYMVTPHPVAPSSVAPAAPAQTAADSPG